MIVIRLNLKWSGRGGGTRHLHHYQRVVSIPLRWHVGIDGGETGSTGQRIVRTRSGRSALKPKAVNAANDNGIEDVRLAA